MATAAELKHGSPTTVSGNDVGIDFIELVDRTESSHARFPLGEHDHGHAYEICYLKHGSQTFIVGRDHFTIRGGEFFITYPHERHGTGHEPLSRSILYWMILNPSAVQTARRGHLGRRRGHSRRAERDRAGRRSKHSCVRR